MPVLVGPSSTASMAGRPSTLHLGALGDAVPSVGKPFLPYSERKKKKTRPLFLRPIPETVCPLPLGRKTSSLFRVSSLDEFQPCQSSRKDSIVKAMVFPVIVYECESWTIKKAELQRMDVFKWWCWVRLLRVPWTARRSDQSILKEINSEYPLEGLMLKLKLQYCGHLMRRADALENTLISGKD